LCDPTIRAHIECLCSDCRQRGLISASRSPSNSLPEAVANFERGIDLVYFANALIVSDESRELLEFSKFTVDAPITTAMSACCGTLMCGTHPIYEGTTISVNADSCRVTVPSNIPLQAVLFACDAPQEEAAEISRRSEVPVIFSVYDELEHPVLQAIIKAITEPVSDSVSAMATTNFEELCAAKPLTISNDLFEGSRAGKP
jgi:hypothetical protein